MRTASNIGELCLTGPVCATIGNFDGVHLGHQQLIKYSQKVSHDNGLNFVLITFWPHPRMVVHGAASHMPLSRRENRLELLAAAGARNILEIPFTPAFAGLSARLFVRNYLCPLNVRELVVGHDFSLGHNREGSVPFLKNMAAENSFNVRQLEPMTLDGAPISSTRLRHALKAGEVEEAGRLLGRYYSICGEVEHGFGRGAALGFPTANLAKVDTIVPGNGVYATYAVCRNKKFCSITNIGHNPTFGGQQITIESFLLDASMNLYDQPMCLQFVARLRTEKKFASADDLKAQIAMDADNARRILAGAGS